MTAVAAFVDRVNLAGDGTAARAAYRDGFSRLRSQLDLYPVSGSRPSVIFASAAKTASDLAADCLPLAIAVAMHLYPICVLQCVPLPLLSLARFQRAMLLRTIRNRSLILANAGSERTRGAQHPLVAHHEPDGVRIDGRCEYMSLASVADVVLFKARLAGGGGTVLCAADLRSETVQIGDWRFTGAMRLSDTCAVTLAGHHVPHGRYVLVPDDEVLRCTADYQRCWFHLFLADMHLARIARLHHLWDLTRPAEQIMSLNELAQLRAYALRLLDDFSSGADIRPLNAITCAIKLRVSSISQSTMAALKGRTDASELGYIRFQPTADEIILRNIGALAS